MYTFCPDCHTVFYIEAAHLHAAKGLVHCGECHHVFDGVDHLYAELPAAREALKEWEEEKAKAAHDERIYSEATEETVEPPGVENTRTEEPARALETGAALEDGDWDGPAAARPLMQPVLAGEWHPPGLPWKGIAKVASILVLLLLLGMQWIYYKRAELAADIAWRPALERFCAILRCDLPLRVDVARIELLNRDVRQHPLVEDALLINASLVNRAGFIQPFPVFEIRFSDLTGSPIAMRRFEPHEYVAEEFVKPGMPPGTPVQIMLEILDPGDDAVSFQFEFL